MSDISTSRQKMHLFYGATEVSVEENIDKYARLLAGINGGVYKAVGSALSRAAQAGKTAAKGAVTKEYTITPSEFLNSTRNINHFVRESSGTITVEFGFAGYVLPLTRFNTRVGSDGLVVTQVKRSGSAAALEHAFAAQMGGHKGIYERIGMARFPVKELYGPATPQMMNMNDSVTDAMEAKMAETYEKRIDHEIERVLNGWGR